MRWIWNTVVAILFVLVMVLGILAVMDNAEPVALRFLNWQTPTLSVYWWLVASLAFGIVLGWLASLRTKLQLRLQARQLKKELEQYRSAAQRDPERAGAP